MDDDTAPLNGISALVNRELVRPDANLEELEHKLLGDSSASDRFNDATAKFNKELAEFARSIGLDYNDILPGVLPGVPPGEIEPDTNSADDRSDSDDDTFEDPIGGGAREETRGSRDNSPSPAMVRSIQLSPGSFGKDITTRTQEQIRRSYIDSVMKSNDQGLQFEYFEQAKREEQKITMLAGISSLLNTLEEDGEDVSKIPRVDRNSSFEEIETVYKILQHKNDRNRCCNMAEECIMFGVYALEELFDGKRTWFGRQPDLTGWHNTVQVKLRRMRYDTAQIVNDIIREYGISPTVRLLLELIPSAFIYSRMKEAQRRQPGLISDDELAAATEKIRSMSVDK